MIIPIWQPLYSSSHQLAKVIGESRGEPATHTGTLDPLAQGVLVVLTGEDRFLKGKLDWPKTYDFQILWGIRTDSGDQLGIIAESTPIGINNDRLANVLTDFPTQYDQQIPDFSARRWKGGSAFDAVQRGEHIEPKSRVVSVSKLSLVKTEALSLSEVLALQQSNVSQIVGNFRQDEIIRSWQNIFSHLPTNRSFVLTTHSVETSPGTYIRQLVQDISERLGIPATTWSITRTRNGPYDLEKTLVDIN